MMGLSFNDIPYRDDAFTIYLGDEEVAQAQTLNAVSRAIEVMSLEMNKDRRMFRWVWNPPPRDKKED